MPTGKLLSNRRFTSHLDILVCSQARSCCSFPCDKHIELLYTLWALYHNTYWNKNIVLDLHGFQGGIT